MKFVLNRASETLNGIKILPDAQELIDNADLYPKNRYLTYCSNHTQLKLQEEN
jgi:hypothetical protein